MFDGLMKSKFYTKSKSSLKMIKARLVVIKKKRSSVQKFLRNDIAELLKNGLDYNAYGRADGLLVEQKITSCYEDVENFCESIYGQLSTMEKQIECPGECKQAVSSLIYAAARFADLPELRDIRCMLTEKYGDSLQPFINKEFVEKLTENPPADEMKFQLMYDIANEFSIKWNSRALVKKLSQPAQLTNDQPKHRPLKDDDGYKREKSTNKVSPKRDRSLDSKNRLNDARLQPAPKRDRSLESKKRLNDARVQVAPEKDASLDSKNRIHDARVQDAPKISVTDEKHRLLSSSTAKEASPSSLGSGLENHVESSTPLHYKLQPQPYIKLNLSKEDDLAADKKPKPDKIPKPTSVRRRSTDDARGKRRESRREHFLSVNDQLDEEERQMDRLLVHYSKKKSPYEAGQEMEHLNLKLKPAEGRHRNVKSELTFPRAESLPTEATYKIKPMVKHLRANSVQPDMLAGHVHPKLPEYDELAARIKALRE